MQFDIANVDLQNKIFPKASDTDPVSTFQPDQNQLHQCPLISPLPNKTNSKTATKSSSQETREFVDSNDDNRTHKEVESSMEDPL